MDAKRKIKYFKRIIEAVYQSPIRRPLRSTPLASAAPSVSWEIGGLYDDGSALSSLCLSSNSFNVRFYVNFSVIESH